MRAFSLVLLILVFILPLPARATGEMSMPVQEEQTYICPMHPHIHGQKGDHCPICGMTLVPAKGNTGAQETAIPDQVSQQGAIHIDNTYRQALGVKTAPASHHELGKKIMAFGHIAPSTRLQSEVAVRTAGWIVDLATDAAGDRVKKGDLLFTYYSPDLMTAQSDFLLGRRVGNAEQRLRLFGMGDQALAALREKGEFLEATPFFAPADGVISMLDVRPGSYLKEGDTVLTIQDYSTVWVNVHVPLRDLTLLSAGDPATVKVSETGETYPATVDYIYPETDPQSREGLVRLVIDNPEGRLKTDTLVDVVMGVDSRMRLAVPEEAVLYGAEGAYVIEALGDGYFRPVMVETGITASGMTEIASGLAHGQEIVTSGQFMIDAESNLKGGMAAMGHDHGAMKDGDSEKQEAGDEHKH